MTSKRPIAFDSRVRPVYSHLEPIVDLLLANGNRLANDFKWGIDRTGYYCHLVERLNFDLVDKSFEIPPFIKLNRQNDSIECAQTWAVIVGGIKKL